MTKCNGTSRITIWNPVTGQFFSKDDDLCPIVDISALVSRNVSKNYRLSYGYR
jgi:hypothetical protein